MFALGAVRTKTKWLASANVTDNAPGTLVWTTNLNHEIGSLTD
jgi:hypothetical protein